MDADRLMFLSVALKNATATHDAAKKQVENLHEQLASAQRDEEKSESARREASRELSDYVIGIQRPQRPQRASQSPPVIGQPMPPAVPQPVPWDNR